MPLTAYPGFLANNGAPYLNVAPMLTPGEVFFVNSVRGNNGNDGRDSIRPKATWQNAYNQCRANRNDMVILLPGHAENVAAAAGMLLNIEGVLTYCLGHGTNRPTITLITAAGASIDVTAANNMIAGVGGPDSGLIIDATGVASVTAALNVQASDFSFINNRMELADATNQAVLGILTDANANDMHIIGNRIFGTVDAGTASAIRIVGGDGAVINDNYIVGAYTTTLGLENVSTASTDSLIQRNFIKNRTASSTICITMHANATGMYSDNRFSILSGATPVVYAAGTNGGANYEVGAVGTGVGTLV